MVENTHTEDEKIREDSNEGLDSSNVFVAFAFTVWRQRRGAADFAVALRNVTLLQKQQLCFQNGDDSTTLNAEDRVFRDLFFL